MRVCQWFEIKNFGEHIYIYNYIPLYRFNKLYSAYMGFHE